jgi:hypothetical protein
LCQPTLDAHLESLFPVIGENERFCYCAAGSLDESLYCVAGAFRRRSVLPYLLS